MDNRAVVERIMKNLAFDLETVPKTRTGDDSTTTSSKTDPLNLKIRVRKKEIINEPHNQGFISNNQSEPEMVLQKIRLVNSDETIMSFDMFMEAELEKKSTRKPRKHLFDKLRPGLCLGATDDDDDQPYMPNSGHSDNGNERSTPSKSDGILRQPFTLTKNTYETFGDPKINRREKHFLGRKCKPGGCLDPPFDEDKYAYKPCVKEPAVRESKTIEPTKVVNQIAMSMKPDTKPPEKRKSKSKELSIKPLGNKVKESTSLLSLFKAESSRNSVITYPSENDNKKSKTRAASEGDESKVYRNRPSSENKSRQSVNESMNSFFSLPKGIIRDSTASALRDPPKRHSYSPTALRSKPVEYVKTPVPISVSLDSVPLENDIENINDIKLADDNFVAPLEPMLIFEDVPQKPMAPFILPLPVSISFPYKLNAADARVTPSNIENTDSSVTAAKKISIESINPTYSSFHRIPKLDLINSKGLKQSEQSLHEITIEKDVETKVLEESPVSSNNKMINEIVSAMPKKNISKLDTRSEQNDNYLPEIIKPSALPKIDISKLDTRNKQNNNYLPEIIKPSALPKIDISKLDTRNKQNDNYLPEIIKPNDTNQTQEEKNRKPIEGKEHDIDELPDIQEKTRESIDAIEKPLKIPITIEHLMAQPLKYGLSNVINENHENKNAGKIPVAITNENEDRINSANAQPLKYSLSNVINENHENKNAGKIPVAITNENEDRINSANAISKIIDLNDHNVETSSAPEFNIDIVPVRTDKIIKSLEEIDNLESKHSKNIEMNVLPITKPQDIDANLNNLNENTYILDSQSDNDEAKQPFKEKDKIDHEINNIRQKAENLFKDNDPEHKKDFEISAIDKVFNVIARKSEGHSDSISKATIEKHKNGSASLEKHDFLPFSLTSDEKSIKNKQRISPDRSSTLDKKISPDRSSIKDKRKSSPDRGSIKDKRRSSPDRSSIKDKRRSSPDSGSLKDKRRSSPDRGSSIDKRRISPDRGSTKDYKRVSPEKISSKVNGRISPDRGRAFLSVSQKPVKKSETDNTTKENLLPSPDTLSTSDLRSVFLDLAFHSYVNSRNERILSTVDVKNNVKRYPNDSIILIKSQIKLNSKENSNEFNIPIDPRLDMALEIKKTDENSKAFYNKSVMKPIPKLVETNVPARSQSSTGRTRGSIQNAQLKTKENDKVCSTLTDIYEQELIPLQTIIRDLKQEIDTLTVQQIGFKKKVLCQKRAKPRLSHSNKRCG